jgi:predicted nucleic acid-binding protein
MLEEAAHVGALYINPIVHAEVAVHFSRIEDLDDALPREYYRRTELPWPAGFLAGRVFQTCRGAGGARRSPLPDFYIGAHAAIAGVTLLTRDATRYRTYFPRLRLSAP